MLRSDSGRSLPESHSAVDVLDASGLVIPAIAATLAAASYVLLGLRPHVPAVLLSASGAFLIYVWDRAWTTHPEDASNRPSRREWHGTHRPYRYLATLIALVAASVSWWLVPAPMKVAAAGLAAVGALHHVSVSGHRAKAHPVVKPVVVGLAWGIGSGILPFLTGPVLFPAALGAVILIRALAVSANVLVSDIHDVQGDREAGIRSMATEMGPKPTRFLAMALLLVAAAVALGAWWMTGSPLWLVEAGGLGVFAMVTLPTSESPPGRLTLDVLVAYPIVTIFASLW